MLYYIVEIAIMNIYIYIIHMYIYIYILIHMCKKSNFGSPKEVAKTPAGLRKASPSGAVTRPIRLPAPFPRLRDRPWGAETAESFQRKIGIRMGYEPSVITG